MSIANPFKKKKIIEHPIFSEGSLAFSNGIELSENPYEKDTDYYFKWIEGWEKASKSRQALEESNKSISTHSSHQFSNSNSNFYGIGFNITAVITFIGCWIYAIASWGFLLGVGLGWIPSLFIAAIAGFVWPLIALVLFLGLIFIAFLIAFLSVKS